MPNPKSMKYLVVSGVLLLLLSLTARQAHAQCDSLAYPLDGVNGSDISSYLENITRIDSTTRRTVNATLSRIQSSQSSYDSKNYKESAREVSALVKAYVDYAEKNDAKRLLAAFETIRAKAIADHESPPTIAFLSNFFLPGEKIRNTRIWRNYLKNTSLDMPDGYYNQKDIMQIEGFHILSLAHAAGNDCLAGTSKVNWSAGPSTSQYNDIVDRFNGAGASEKECDWWCQFKWWLMSVAVEVMKAGGYTGEAPERDNATAGVRGIVGGGIPIDSILDRIGSKFGSYGGPITLPHVGSTFVDPVAVDIDPQVTPTSYMILYDAINFDGKSEKFDMDDPNLIDNFMRNNTVSSIKIIGNCTVTLYENANYTGRSEQFTKSDSDLRNNRIGNDTVSSLKISRRQLIKQKNKR